MQHFHLAIWWSVRLFSAKKKEKRRSRADRIGVSCCQCAKLPNKKNDELGQDRTIVSYPVSARRKDVKI